MISLFSTIRARLAWWSGMRCRDILVVKVQWRHRPVEEATWEIERDMRAQYPYLFEASADPKCKRLDDDNKFFELMEVKDVVSWNTLVTGYSQIGRFDDTLELFERMRKDKIELNVVTWSVVILGFEFDDDGVNGGVLMCVPHTRSSGKPLLPINPEPYRIGRMEAQRDIERRAAQQEKARLAAMAASQVHQQNIDNHGRTTNPDDKDLGDDELLNPRRDDEVATPTNRRNRQAKFRLERRSMQIPFDDDDDDLDEAGSTRAIIPPPLAPGSKCNITSTMIQLLQLKGLFCGLAGDDPNMHLINFISTCKSFDNPGVGQNTIRLRLFPLSLSGEATRWLNGLTPDSITNWRQLKDAFLERFFPPSKRAQSRDEISNF
ncbi:Pentatricopeptide repeat-containing protein [Capsicum baccatum]|uniref:Pentatricopeptide repeat-containing protein n=1 Tax=Capsicum baccatum TaxID=33114 RepID=A0A2G2X2C9_CAPBA|nr:Pentatricopeptide repeat-containing protein [Capsicum baccatum]